MPPSRRDLSCLRDMRAAALEAISFAAGMSLADMEADIRTRRAVERSVFIIGEAAYHVSGDLVSEAPHIPWQDIVGMRNILGHQYGDVVVERLWRVVTQRLPELVADLDALIARIE